MIDKIKNIRKKLANTLKKKIEQGRTNSRWFDVMELLVSAITLSTYCMISPILAEYQGKKAVYWTAVSVIVLLLLIAAWEIICLVGYDTWKKIFSKLIDLIRKAPGITFRWFRASRLIYILPLAVIIGTGMGIVFWQFHSTDYYTSIVEIYGIPVGMGEPLSYRERKNCADYWKIEDYSLRKTMIVTHEEAYHEDEIMREYSSIYNMAFFQPVDRMVYQYKKNKRKFRSLDDEKAYMTADENQFREPTKISYYNSSDKLILQLEKDGDRDRFDILTYSLDSEPQLLNSTLLRIPEEEEDSAQQLETDEKISRNAIGASIMSQEIEVTYNADGLPETRRISPNIYNLYGVNGERYLYNTDKQLTTLYYLDISGNPICNQKGIMMVSFEYGEGNRLTGIRYYSDANGEEKIEGFQGVFCEKYEYDADGNLCARKQLNQSENRWYDKNGVCEYQYTYSNGRLSREDFLDFSGNKAQNKKVKSTSVEFSKEEDTEGNEMITVSLDPVIRLAEQETVAPVEKMEGSKQQKPKQNAILAMSGSVSQDKNDGQKEQDEISGAADTKYAAFAYGTWDAQKGEKAKASSEKAAGDSPGTEDGETETEGSNTSQIDMPKEEVLVRNYTKVRYKIPRNARSRKVSYYREDESQEDKLVKNEQGFSIKQLDYDSKFRIMEKTYFDEQENPCLTADGYSQVIFQYADDSEEKARIEYRDIKSELAVNKSESCGYAVVEYKPYGENDRNGETTITLEYHGQDDRSLQLSGKGYAKIRQTYNKRGLLVKEIFYNEEEGEEVPAYRTEYMAAGIDYEYSDDGNLICEIYKDAQDQPVNRHDGGFAMKFREFENGKLAKIHYKGYKDGILQDVPNKEYGIGSVQYFYANGHQVEERYFDIDGNPVLRSDQGYSVQKMEYNNRGMVAAYLYYGTDGELILRKDEGYAVIRYQYDELGRVVLHHYYGVNQEPIISTEYCCFGMQYQYDQRGNRNSIRYLDENKNLMTRSDLGYAGINRKYNADGKLVEVHYFDSEEHPVEGKEKGYAFYKGVYEGKNLVRVEYRDRYDKLVANIDTGYAIAAYKYNDQGKCIWENYFDKNVQPVISKKYHCAGFRLAYDEENNQEIIGYLGLHGETIIRSDLGYAQVMKQYDDYRNLIKEIYYDADVDLQSADEKTANQHKVLCKEGGYASFEDQFDTQGNCVKNIYRDKGGELTLRKDYGCAVIENEYDDFGRNIRVTYYGTDYDLDADENQNALVFNAEYGCAGFRYGYDENGNLTDISYMDTDGKPMVRKDIGFARERREYDGQGNQVAESYYDVDNNPTARKEEGYASCKMTYQNGKCIEKAYYDTDGKPVLRKDQGFAIERWQYDELGQCISDAFYDTKGDYIINKKYMCAAFVYEYDSRGYRTDIWYRDIDGEIMIRPDLGYAHEKSEYDNRGNLVKQFYYDTRERLTLSKEGGIAYFVDQFNEYGNCLGGKSYGKNRELKVRKDRGYAYSKNIRDKYGQWVSVSYYGADGKTPILSPKYHCAGFRYEYDEMGEKVITKYVGENGNIIIREDLGFAQEKIIKKYDSGTNSIIEKGYLLGCSGEPAAKLEGGYTSYENIYVCDKWVETRYYKGETWENQTLLKRSDIGYAIIRKEYDEFGQCTSESYYDEEEEPVCYLKGGNGTEICAAFVYEYDEKGNMVDIKYKDSDGSVMVRYDLGYAQVCREYDEQGNITEERYYDADHKPTAVASGGYYSIDYIYNNSIYTECRYYDAEKRLMMRSDQNYAIQRQIYDKYGQCILLSYYDTDDEPVMNTWYGGAAFEYRYDQLGNETDIIYQDTKGNVTVREKLGYAWVKQKYDEWGRMERETYYDTEENPVIGVNGYAGIRYEYDEQGRTEREIYCDVEQNPTMDVNGYAGIIYEYDDQGKMTKHPFDLNGAEMNE